MSPQYVHEIGGPAGQDPREVGGKAAGLAGLAAAGLPVAPGFVVGAAAYRAFLDGADLRGLVRSALATPGPHVGERLAGQLAAVPVPAAVAAAVRSRYLRLCAETGTVDVPVAVRSSATAEDATTASFAGGFESWIGVAGTDDVVAHVHRCWSGVFTTRAVEYARRHGVDLADVEMAVVVQKAVRARAAGVMLTLSPVTGDRSRITIEASWGLGLAVVGGEVTPDRWVVDKVGLTVVDRIPGDKRVEYRSGDGPVAVDPDRWARPALSDEQVIALARLGKQIERQHRCPQDIEFAVDEDAPPGAELVLLQRRPETVWSGRPRTPRFTAGHDPTSWISSAMGGSGAGSPAP